MLISRIKDNNQGPNKDFAYSAQSWDTYFVLPNDQVISFWCTHSMTKDNSIKKIRAYPRIKLDKDYIHDEERNNLLKWIHAHIYENETKGNLINQVDFEQRC